MYWQVIVFFFLFSLPLNKEKGYIGNYAILEKIENMVQKLKSKNSKLIYGKYDYKINITCVIENLKKNDV